MTHIRKVATLGKYDFYEGTTEPNGKKFFNIVPVGTPAPSGGYYSSEYICEIKQVPNLFKRYSTN